MCSFVFWSHAPDTLCISREQGVMSTLLCILKGIFNSQNSQYVGLCPERNCHKEKHTTTDIFWWLTHGLTWRKEAVDCVENNWFERTHLISPCLSVTVYQGYALDSLLNRVHQGGVLTISTLFDAHTSPLSNACHIVSRLWCIAAHSGLQRHEHSLQIICFTYVRSEI